MKRDSEDLICDDRLNTELLNEDIDKMTEEEKEELLAYIRKHDDYPPKYYLV